MSSQRFPNSVASRVSYIRPWIMAGFFVAKQLCDSVDQRRARLFRLSVILYYLFFCFVAFFFIPLSILKHVLLVL